MGDTGTYRAVQLTIPGVEAERPLLVRAASPRGPVTKLAPPPRPAPPGPAQARESKNRSLLKELYGTKVPTPIVPTRKGFNTRTYWHEKQSGREVLLK